MLALLLFVAGILLSAFFSGSETGFYRMTRLRLIMDAATGDRIARAMLWMANHPTLFVATALVGNNLANFMASSAVVMGTHEAVSANRQWVDLAAPIVIAPIIFICGELLPKNLFYAAPNRLMRRSGPALIFCAVLFAPISIVLWLVSQLLGIFSRETPQELRVSLARREVGELMTQGHEAGILKPVQRALAQNMLAIAGQPVSRFATPAKKVARVTTTMSRSEILRIAQRQKRTLLPIEDPQNNRALVGYVRSLDVRLADSSPSPAPLPLIQLQASETFLSAIGKFSVANDALGRVVDTSGETVGFVTGRELRMALFRIAS